MDTTSPKSTLLVQVITMIFSASILGYFYISIRIGDFLPLTGDLCTMLGLSSTIYGSFAVISFGIIYGILLYRSQKSFYIMEVKAFLPWVFWYILLLLGILILLEFRIQKDMAWVDMKDLAIDYEHQGFGTYSPMNFSRGRDIAKVLSNTQAQMLLLCNIFYVLYRFIYKTSVLQDLRSGIIDLSCLSIFTFQKSLEEVSYEFPWPIRNEREEVVIGPIVDFPEEYVRFPSAIVTSEVYDLKEKPHIKAYVDRKKGTVILRFQEKDGAYSSEYCFRDSRWDL